MFCARGRCVFHSCFLSCASQELNLDFQLYYETSFHNEAGVVPYGQATQSSFISPCRTIHLSPDRTIQDQGRHHLCH